MLKVRTSERRSFKRCRKRWEYEYVEGLIPKGRNSKLWVGDYVHQALAVYYSGKPEPDADSAREFIKRHEFMARKEFGYNQLEEDERERLNEDIWLAQGMLDHYFVWAPDHDNFTVHHVELYAELPVGRGAVHTLRADALVENDEGYWLLEHKTASAVDADAAWLEIDDQATTYTWAFMQPENISTLVDGKLVKGAIDLPPIRGMIYSFLLKQVPHEPVMNKDDSLSVASKNLTCTAEDYEEAIKGTPDPSDLKYVDFLQKLQTKKWFHRLLVYRGKDELAGFEELLLAELGEIKRAREHPLIRYRNPTRDCAWDCPFLEVCKGELEGLDMDFTKTEKFDVEEQIPLL